MRLPKTINVSGRVFKVTKNPKMNGGKFDDIQHQEIVIGTNAAKDFQLQTFFHEVFELILRERGHMYNLPYDEVDNGTLIFVFNHLQLENISKDLAYAFKPLLKE